MLIKESDNYSWLQDNLRLKMEQTENTIQLKTDLKIVDLQSKVVPCFFAVLVGKIIFNSD